MKNLFNNKSSQWSNLGSLLYYSLQKIDKFEQTQTERRKSIQPDNIFTVSTVGSKVSVAYEQIRNVSEYGVLGSSRQLATRRFLKRNLDFFDHKLDKTIATELIIELTQADYIQNSSVDKNQLQLIYSIIKKYYSACWNYRKIEPNSTRQKQFKNWSLDVMSVRIEAVLVPNLRQLSFANLALQYYQDQFTFQDFARPEQTIRLDKNDFQIILYVAIMRALLEANDAFVRTALIDAYKKDVTFLHRFEDLNLKLDALFESQTLNAATRLINQNGASFRMIYSGFYLDSKIPYHELESEESLTYSLQDHIEKQYSALDKILDNGVIRSIIFLLITKSMIGLLIEVPYDLVTEHHVAWLPLAINLMFPAAFIALSRLTLKTPDQKNTDLIINHINGIIFNNIQTPRVRKPRQTRSVVFNIIYFLGFLLAISGTSYILYLLKFNIVGGVIFFIFVSTASFLAYRMSLQIKKIQALSVQKNFSQLIQDLLYLPFVQIGQIISDKYSKVNIFANILDNIIEMPLKSFLRAIRQWSMFIDNKKDNLS